MPSPKLMTAAAVRARAHRRYLLLVGLLLPLVVVGLYFALDFATAGRVPSAIRYSFFAVLYLVPISWAALICSAWFDPDRGVFNRQRIAWLGWPAAVFLSFYAVVAVVGPLIVFFS